MKKLLLNLHGFIAAMLCLHAGAQTGTIRGQINNKEGNGLAAVTVSLLYQEDSSLAKTSVSEVDGKFEIIHKAGERFLLRYSATGYDVKFTDVFVLKAGEELTVPTVVLTTANLPLKTITVTAAKPLIEVKAGKTVMNVQNSITGSGSNALELLQKSPGITVDNNDNISIKGKTGIKIYVDGKMIPFGNEDLAAYLKSINSNDIESIEIITNPGVSFDASGSAGVINFKMRKNPGLGTNGSMTAGLIQGKTVKGNGAINLNHRNRTMNAFFNGSVNAGRQRKNIDAPRTQKDTTYNQRLLQMDDGRNFHIKAGLDYFINSKHTIGLMNATNYITNDYESTGTTDIYYRPTNAFMKKLAATNAIPSKRTRNNTNINYRFADTSGRELNIDINRGLFRGRSKSYQPNYYYDENNHLLSEIITYNHTPTDIDIYTAQADVQIRLWKGRLSAGGKYGQVKTDNTLEFFNGNNGDKVIVPERSYHFVYNERVAAFYANYFRQLDAAWSLTAGLRMEHANSKGLLQRGDGIVQPDQRAKRQYFDFFPNVVLHWAANGQHQFSLAYDRRIDRPNYQGLNPFEMKLDELTYVKGNSFLKPQYTDNIELSHTWNSRFTTSAGYSHIKDLATQTVDTFRNYTYATTKNLADQKIVSFNLGTPLRITRWWNGFVYVWINHQTYRGKVNESFVSLHSFASGANMQHSITLGKNYSAELSGYFNSGGPLSPTLIARPFGGLDIGFQKLVFQKKGTVRIAATDIFKTSVPFRAKTDFGGLLLNFSVWRESQTVKLIFTYRFGNGQVKAARQRTSGLEAETKRITEN